MIKRLDETFMSIFKLLMNYLLPILILVLIMVIIKFLFDYKKYGKKVFLSFKKQKNIDISKESLELSIKNLKTYYKIIEFDKNTFCLILCSGIYVFNICNYRGIISGEISDEKLIFKKDTNDEAQIDNPVYIVQKKIIDLSKKTNCDIEGYILLKTGCVFAVLNRTNIKAIPVNAFYYRFSSLIKENKFTDIEIDRIASEINKTNL